MAKTDYKRLVLEYLQNHIDADITRDSVISATGISKSRLSEIVNSIRDDGYTIVSPPRSGLLRLESSENQVILPNISDSDLRQWVILLLLSIHGPLTFRDLILKTLDLKEYGLDASSDLLKLNSKKVYDDNHLIKSIRINLSNDYLEDIDVANDYISVTTLRKDLAKLTATGMVSKKEGRHVIYSLTNKAPLIIPVSEDSLYEFCQQYEENISSLSELEPVKNAYKKIRDLICYDSSEVNQRRFGKLNQISDIQIEKFNSFLTHPYKTNRIQINSRYQDKERHDEFSVGLLFYSVETGAFYALGQNHTHNRIETIRIDFIDSIDDLNKNNNVFHASEIYEIYGDMFAAGYDKEVYHVKVLFQDFGNVTARFQNIHTLRKKSTIRRIDNKPEDCIYNYVYEDNIRGLRDFARFLRSFGYSALAVEPPELTDLMKNTYTRSLEKYEELEGNNNG